MAIVVALALVTTIGGQAAAVEGTPPGGDDSPLELAPGLEQRDLPNYDFSLAPGADTTADAERLARSSAFPVEDLSQRTASESYFALPEGYWAVTQFLGEAFAIDPDADGATQYQPIDARLVADAEGWLRPVNAPGDLRINAGGGDSPVLLELTAEGSETALSVTPDFGLPRASIDGARATYAGVAEGVDLIVEARGGSFELFLVAQTPDALAVAESLTWEYSVDNGTVQLAGSGDYEVLDSQGVVVGRFAPPLGWDARTDARSSNPVLEAWSDVPMVQSQSAPVIPRGTAAVRVEGSGAPLVAQGESAPLATETLAAEPDAVTVSLDAPAEWDEPGGAQYPVVLDPYYEAGYTTPFDSDVNYGSPNTAYPYTTELRLGTGDGGGSRYRIFAMLPLYPVFTKDVYAASFQLYEYHSWSCAARDWYVAWTEEPNSAMTWNSQLGSKDGYTWGVSSQTTGYSSSCGDGWVGIDVTSLARMVLDKSPRPNYLNVRLSTNETDNYSWKRFNSVDAGWGMPYILYWLNREPNTPTAVSVDGDSVTPGSTIKVDPGEGILTATVSDPDLNTVALAVTIKRGVGADQRVVFESKRSASVASGGQATLKLAPYLAAGEHYTVEVRSWDGRRESVSSWGTFSFDTVDPLAADFSPADDERDPQPSPAGGQS